MVHEIICILRGFYTRTHNIENLDLQITVCAAQYSSWSEPYKFNKKLTPILTSHYPYQNLKTERERMVKRGKEIIISPIENVVTHSSVSVFNIATNKLPDSVSSVDNSRTQVHIKKR